MDTIREKFKDTKKIDFERLVQKRIEESANKGNILRKLLIISEALLLKYLSSDTWLV